MSDNAQHIPHSLTITAEQITDLLKSALQTVRVAYLNVGYLLAIMRDEKRYAELGFANLDAYARNRLQLGRTSLYNYLRVYDWVAQNHPEWLNPGPDTVIPDLSDTVDLIWIEKELGHETLTPTAQSKLKELKVKALNGQLKKADRATYIGRTRRTKNDGRSAFLSRLRALRSEGAKLAGLPPEIVSGLDELIAILKHAIDLPLPDLENAETGNKADVA